MLCNCESCNGKDLCMEYILGNKDVMPKCIGLYDRRIQVRIQQHLDYYQTQYSNDWVGIFLQGSQNYRLQTENSNIDTKIIVLPSFEDICLNRQPVSHTLVLPNNEHCDVKDIRLMFDCFKKQNINFLEILFTKWKIMNPEYEELFLPVLENREQIAHYNNHAAANCMNGMIAQKHKSMLKPTPATQSVIDQYGYNGKDLCHMFRIYYFYFHFLVNDESFEECLNPRSDERMIEMMAKEHGYSKEKAVELSDKINDFMKEINKKYLEDISLKVDTEVDDLFKEVLIKILAHAFRKEINYE